MAMLAISVMIWREYNRRPVGMMQSKEAWAGSDVELAKEFNTNEQAANSRFLGKVLRVNGVVDHISSQGDTIFNVTLAASFEGKVSCTMDPEFNKEVIKLRVGDHVSIRGECAGYLADVELNRCVLIK